MEKPLKGRMILDCSTLLPGPLIGKLMSEMGARVLKIENPQHPDGARAMGEFYPDLNECKELHWLNLKESGDSEKFRDLVRSADGLIEAFRPQAKKKLGLDADSLRAINPKLCIVSLVGYRSTSPRRDRAGHDINFEAQTGALSLFREMPGLPLADLFGAYQGAFALSALLDASARGKGGGVIEVSLAETLLKVQSGFFREFKKTGVAPNHGTTLMSGVFPCYRIYSTNDGRKIAVGAIEQKFWSRLCEVLRLPECADHGYATGDQGIETHQKIEDLFASKSLKEWQTVFENEDCCVEPVLEYQEVEPHGL